MRFYYNLGVEYYKLLQSVHGTGQLMAMIDGDPCAGNSFEQQSNEIDSQQNQMVSDLQQMNFESNDIEIQSPSKVCNQLMILNDKYIFLLTISILASKKLQ